MQCMNRIITTIVVILTWGMWSNPVLTGGEEPAQQPSARDRLNQVLGPEGGIQVYKDEQGAVETTTTLPNGEQTIIVQPPQGAGINLGPPLQLNNPTLQDSPSSTIPPDSPKPDFPQRAFTNPMPQVAPPPAVSPHSPAPDFPQRALTTPMPHLAPPSAVPPGSPAPDFPQRALTAPAPQFAPPPAVPPRPPAPDFPQRAR